MVSAYPIHYLSSPPHLRVCLLSRFEVLSDGQPVPVPHVGSRVIAFLALQPLPVTRSRVAGVLWPETTDNKAQASLRSALWRINKASQQLVQCRNDSLCLDDSVEVDVDCLTADSVPSDRDGLLADLRHGGELLPDWTDDWVLFERERLRLAALDTMEEMSACYCQAGDFRLATEYAMMAIKTEPLRESARRMFVQVQLAQGNVAEAISHYHDYARLLARELSIGPSPLLVDLIRSTGYVVD